MKTIKSFIKKIDSVDVLLITATLLYVSFLAVTLLKITE
jgi:hypothetical protein